MLNNSWQTSSAVDGDMADIATKPRIGFYATMFVVLFITTFMHELVHLLTALAYGVETFAISLGRVSYQIPGDPSDFAVQGAIISISGPLFTLTMGLFGAWLSIARKISFGYDLVFIAFFQRLMAMSMSAITGYHNDEARVSLELETSGG